MFKRPKKLSFGEKVQETLYPRGGWLRAAKYLFKRLQRVPDTPHRVARGVFAGVFVSFTPLFGVHFFIAPVIAWGIGGNIPASIVAVLFCNPLTFPIIAAGSLTLGSWILDIQLAMIHPDRLLQLFWDAAWSVWTNLVALVTLERADWTAFSDFLMNIFLPYLVGGVLLGLVAGLVVAGISLPVFGAYQKRRVKWRRRKKESRMTSEGAGGPVFAKKDPATKIDRQ